MAEDSRTLILKFQAEIETARQQLKILGDATGTTATKIDVDLSKLEASFDRTNKGISVKALALATTLGSAFGNLVGNTLSQIPQSLERIVSSSINAAGSIKNTAEQLGISTDALQTFRIGAENAGVGTAKADAALDHFQQTVGKAANGNKAAADAFKIIGVDIADAQGNLKPFDTLLDEVADGLAKVPDPARQAADAVKLFGSNGDALLPFLRGGSQGIRDLSAASEALGLKLSPETISRLDTLGNKAQRIKEIIDAQLAAAVGQNADALLRLGTAAVSTINGLSSLIRVMGQLDRAKGLLEKGEFREAGNIFQNDRLDALNDKFPLPRAAAPSAPGGKVTPVALARVAKPKAAKAPKPEFDFDAAYAELLKTPATTSFAKDDAGMAQLLNNPSAFLNPTKAAEKLGDTLRNAFDTKNLEDLVQTIPDLTDGLKESEAIGQEFIGNFVYGLMNAIDQSTSLGDALIQTFKRAGLELIGSGLLSFLSGGKQGVSFGSSLKGISSLFSGKGFASGGEPPVGQFSMVGERGPELFMPKVLGTIIPNGRLGGGSGSTYQTFDLRGAVVTEDLYARMNAIGAQAAQSGAIGGSRMAAADRARSARRSLR